MIRLAMPADAAAIATVLRRSFEHYRLQYTPAAFDATVLDAERIGLRMKEGPVWVAILDDRLVGTGSVVATGKGCYVRGMGVVPEARGREVGRLLLAAAEDFARARGLARLYLSTTPFLDRAIRLYERYGFARTGEGPADLFGTPLFTMAKPLGGGGGAG